jgi:hypothetical protein
MAQEVIDGDSDALSLTIRGQVVTKKTDLEE